MKPLKEIKLMLSKAETYEEHWIIYRELIQYLMSYPISNAALTRYLGESSSVFEYVKWYVSCSDTAPYVFLCNRFAKACIKISRSRYYTSMDNIPLLFLFITPMLSYNEIIEVAQARKARYHRLKQPHDDVKVDIKDRIIMYANDPNVIHGDCNDDIIDRYKSLDDAYRRLRDLGQRIDSTSRYLNSTRYKQCEFELDTLDKEYHQLIDQFSSGGACMKSAMIELSLLEKKYATVRHVLAEQEKRKDLQAKLDQMMIEANESAEDIIFDVNYINRIIGYQLIEVSYDQ